MPEAIQRQEALKATAAAIDLTIRSLLAAHPRELAKGMVLDDLPDQERQRLMAVLGRVVPSMFVAYVVFWAEHLENLRQLLKSASTLASVQAAEMGATPEAVAKAKLVEPSSYLSEIVSKLVQSSTTDSRVQV